MSALTEIKKAFDGDAARRHAAGLPLEQAKLVALNQLVRDARNGELDSADVAQLVIEEEVARGRSPEAAKAHVEALLAGKSSDYAKRDYGYSKGRSRRHRPVSGGNETAADLGASRHLSHWANTMVTTGKA